MSNSTATEQIKFKLKKNGITYNQVVSYSKGKISIANVKNFFTNRSISEEVSLEVLKASAKALKAKSKKAAKMSAETKKILSH